MFWDKAMRYDTIILHHWMEERWTAIASGKVSDNSMKLQTARVLKMYFIDYLIYI